MQRKIFCNFIYRFGLRPWRHYQRITDSLTHLVKLEKLQIHHISTIKSVVTTAESFTSKVSTYYLLPSAKDQNGTNLRLWIILTFQHFEWS